MNLVDHLYQMLRDDDPLIVCNCLSALEEILANEGGIIITRKMAHYLINRYSCPKRNKQMLIFISKNRSINALM